MEREANTLAPYLLRDDERNRRSPTRWLTEAASKPKN